MLKTKLISCLEKPFADESFDKYPEYKKMSALAADVETLANNLEEFMKIIYQRMILHYKF